MGTNERHNYARLFLHACDVKILVSNISLEVQIWLSFSFFSYALLCMYCQLNYPAVITLDCDIAVRLSYLFWPSYIFWLLCLLLFCSGWWKGSSIRRCQHPYPWQQGTWRTLHRGNHWSLQGIPRDQMPWCWGEILDTLSLFSGNFRTMHVDRSVQIILVFI